MTPTSDTTIKVLYGRQDAAVVSYNPHKPGRPSHAIHTYRIGNLRLVLDAQLEPGCWPCWRVCPSITAPNWSVAIAPSAVKARWARWRRSASPTCSSCAKARGVKRLVQRQWTRRDWARVGQGWEGCEDVLRLTGWSQARRLIVMRRARKLDLIVQAKRGGRGRGNEQVQVELHFIDENEAVRSWEYAVLVCNAHYELQSIGPLYRDRADCENGFDEIKNPWGWGGYSAHDIERCALSARAVARVYNGWSGDVHLAHPKTRLEAITSRPKLLSAVGRMTRHGGQKKILLTIRHEAVAQIKRLVANVHAD